jgi:hypothetical protein
MSLYHIIHKTKWPNAGSEKFPKGFTIPFASLQCAGSPLTDPRSVGGAPIRKLVDVVEVWDRVQGNKVINNSSRSYGLGAN